MTNQTIVEEIIHRIGRAESGKYGFQSILRQMEAIYFIYNRRYLGAVKGSLEIVFGDAETDFSYTLPDDFLQPYFIDPKASWRNKKVFQDDEAGTFTIDQGKIYFVSAAGITFTLEYFGRGKYLSVLDPGESLATTHVSSPEWEQDFHWLLVLAVATRLSTKYELYKTDIIDRNELQRQLKKVARTSQQAARPIVSGPLYRRSSTESDIYSPDYTGNYFV